MWHLPEFLCRSLRTMGLEFRYAQCIDLDQYHCPHDAHWPFLWKQEVYSVNWDFNGSRFPTKPSRSLSISLQLIHVLKPYIVIFFYFITCWSLINSNGLSHSMPYSILRYMFILEIWNWVLIIIQIKDKTKFFTNLKGGTAYSQLNFNKSGPTDAESLFCLVCFSEIKSCNAQVFLWIFSREFLLSLLGAKTAGWDHFTIVTSEVC